MGIRGLNNIIKKHAPESIIITNIKKYSGSVVAIDCSILLYKFKYASKDENSHLVGIANRVKFYLTNGILPVFVFDGLPIEAKKKTIEKRNINKEKLYVKLEELRSKITELEIEEDKNEIEQEIEKVSSQIITIKKHHINEVKELLTLAGIPYCTAPDDAEKFCAFLEKNGIVDYTVTDDTDALTFGCKKILKTSISKIIEVNTDIFLEKIGMDMNMFVDFCILSGCDYTDTINQIGPVTSFNLIKKHGNIEEVIKKIDSNVKNFDYIAARKIFTEFDYILPERFTVKKAQKLDLINFMEKNNFKENVIFKFLKILIFN
jgi:flap endonuclease-1